MDKWYMQNGEWTISRSKIRGNWRYALWHKTKNHGFFDSFEEADTTWKRLVDKEAA